jgi:hypothetical protein
MTHTMTRAALSVLALIALAGAAFAGDPGTPIPPPPSILSDQYAGTVLVYNAYTSDASNPATADTRVNITNTNQSISVSVHLFFLRGSDCNVADSFLCLTENQTASFQMSDLDPGVSGYIIAIESNAAGVPLGRNTLIGDAYVKYASGHAANLGAIAAVMGNISVSADQTTSNVSFQAGRVLAVDNIPSRADGNDTLLILNNVNGSLVSGLGAVGSFFGVLYNDVETPYSFSFTGTSCQFRNSINSPTPFRLSPPLSSIVPSGRTGWIRLTANSNPVLGAAINRNTMAAGFNGGHNLHILTTTTTTLTVPIIGSNCPDLGPSQ